MNPARVARETVGSAMRSFTAAFARLTASDVTVVLTTILACGLVGTTLVGTELAVLALVAGLVVAVATRLLASSRPFVRIVGSTAAVPAAILVVSTGALASIVALTSAGVGLFGSASVWALVVAGLAVGLVSWDRFGSGGVRRGSTGTLLSAIGVILVVLAMVVPNEAVRERAVDASADVVSTFTSTVVYGEGEYAVLTFAAVVLFSAFASSRTLGYLPLSRLIPPDRREGFARAVGIVRRLCSLLIRLSVVGAIAAVGASAASDRVQEVPITPAEIEVVVPEPGGELLVALVHSSALRIGLLAVFGVAVGVAVLEWLRRVAGGRTTVVLARVFAPVVGGGLVALLLARLIADPELEAALDSTLSAAPDSIGDLLAVVPPVAIAAFVLTLALFSLASLLFSVTALRVFRILPGRATGPALAAGSLFVLAIGLVVTGRVETGIWTAVVAFVVWDVGEYADGVRTELGTDAASMRAELVHAGGSFLTAAVVAVGTTVLYRQLAAESVLVDPRLAAVALGAGLFVVALVSWAFRG